jgi:uncharacterized membrane protein
VNCATSDLETKELLWKPDEPVKITYILTKYVYIRLKIDARHAIFLTVVFYFLKILTKKISGCTQLDIITKSRIYKSGIVWSV